VSLVVGGCGGGKGEPGVDIGLPFVFVVLIVVWGARSCAEMWELSMPRLLSVFKARWLSCIATPNTQARHSSPSSHLIVNITLAVANIVASTSDTLEHPLSTRGSLQQGWD
jgi:hypothetical protein